MHFSRLSGLPSLALTTLTIGLALALPAHAQPQQAQASLNGQQVAQMLSQAESIFAGQQLVGLQAAVYDGQRVHELNLGYADIEHRVPVSSETRFEIASITKAFTGLAQLLLAQSGELDLDRPVQDYVPEFPATHDGTLTTRQLAGATGGIRHYQAERDAAFYATHYDSVIEALDLFKEDPLVAAPGATSHYSSYGFNLMAAVIERAAERPFTDVVRTRVLNPMGLANTGFTDVRTPMPNRSRHYTFIDLYSREALPSIQVMPTLNHSYNMGGGNMYSTASDLVSFGRQLIVPGFLSDDVRAELEAPHFTSGGQPSMFSDGWVMIGLQAQPRFLMAGGSYPGTLSLLLVFPELQVVAAMLTNTWGPDGPDVMDRLIMGWTDPALFSPQGQD
ncbi:serine hydrolase domain-containing protein [Pseudohongiella sp. SYSU M77423]|uniref:serine hydrolase domain-containing protein n=1 Tax=Pseudohongiella sp. SYSU M77423 TaxID=3042312 RepID=UPI00248155FB|nr:serine hydrolase domain-containing protein [Pseudohongiella sp. SYSU M77423]MDH7943835.1 serine hydrolase domain-containing protein [Pseudohongiella sp. SYSU M77423]MEC8861289.1 serine hydrolase domain-containing protein [Pseudomonadota bacterium]